MTDKELTAQDFVTDYNKLVEKYQYQLVALPSLKPRDDGTFSIVVNMQVVKLPKTES